MIVRPSMHLKPGAGRVRASDPCLREGCRIGGAPGGKQLCELSGKQGQESLRRDVGGGFERGSFSAGNVGSRSEIDTESRNHPVARSLK